MLNLLQIVDSPVRHRTVTDMADIMQQRSSAGFRLCVFPDRHRNLLDENRMNKATLRLEGPPQEAPRSFITVSSRSLVSFRLVVDTGGTRPS